MIGNDGDGTSLLPKSHIAVARRAIKIIPATAKIAGRKAGRKGWVLDMGRAVHKRFTPSGSTPTVSHFARGSAPRS
jgi:hypothetical protein